MKLYLLLLALAVCQASGFRVLRRNSFSLRELPDSISFLRSELLVSQSGRTIQVYNTTSQKVEQTFVSDTTTPEVQISEQAGMILFKNKKSIFQLQETTQKQNFSSTSNQTNWAYGFGTANRTIIAHELSSKGSYRQVRYLNTVTNQVDIFAFENDNENVVAGSGVEALSSEEYYFASGGICYNEEDQAVFFLFKGDSKGIHNVYNLTVPGCIFVFLEGHKQNWLLSSVDSGNGNRLHAVTYTLD